MPVIGQYPLFERRATTLSSGSGGEEPPPTGDDLTTWPSNAAFETLELPGTPPLETQDSEGNTIYVPQDTEPYFVVFEVTSALTPEALASTNSLRFTGTNGVRLGHLRTATNRIFVGGTFYAGIPVTVTYYWGKTGQSQPGTGFPSSAELLAPFRLFLIFENGSAVDYSASPATWTTVGSPTFVAGRNGQAMVCGDGNHIQTTAAKLRGDARTSRHAMALTYMPDAGGDMRTICWSDWGVDQRAFQLWGHSGGTELYIDDDGVIPFQRWTNPTAPVNGWNWIGESWTANVSTALVQSNEDVRELGPDFIEGPDQGLLHNSTSPYIIGGTPLAGSFHAGSVEAVFELIDPISSAAQMQAWFFAWRENAMFVGEDREPDAFTIPSLTSQERTAEVAFAAVQITGISPDTQIVVSGPGNPSYAVSSSSEVVGDIRTKGTGIGAISHGNWVHLWHTTSASYSTTVVDTITIGSESVNFQSSTKSEPGVPPPDTGGDGIPTGVATYTVSSLAALRDVINNQLQGGQIVEIVSGDYKSEGSLNISNKHFGDGAPAVIRSDVRAYRGPHPTEGGLWVDMEGPYQSGSKGAEFRGIYVTGCTNLVLDGLRSYQGATTADWIRYYQNNTKLIVQYCIMAGHKASGYISGWGYGPGYTWGIDGVPKGWWISGCQASIFKKCLFQYWVRGCWFWGAGSTWATGTTFEDCVFNNQGGDNFYTSGPNGFTTFRGCIWGQMFAADSSFHKDHYQCTAKDLDSTRDQLIELCIMGPIRSSDPHIQGLFLEQDSDTHRGVERVHVKDTLIEGRAVNSLVMDSALDCTIERLTMLQNQFGGSTSATRDTLFHNPQINVGGNSRGGNQLLNTIYHSLSWNAGDFQSGNSQLWQTGYGTHLFDYPQYDAGLWRPCLYLTEKACVDAAELKRMAPKTTSTYHPNQTDIGAWRVFDRYGALP